MIRRIMSATLAATALALAAPATLAGAADEVTTQLPRNVVPTHYSIRVTPEPAKLAFSGTVAIDITVASETNSITLNAADLSIASAKIKDGPAAKVSTDAEAQTATFTFDAPLKAGKAVLEIAYSGKIYEQANGLFALDYKDPQGAQQRALFTQFEAPDARRVIPSWDEPNYKATFDLTAVVNAKHMAVSNMPVAGRKELGNGLAEVTFRQTPKMSTYLLFFGVGDFERISKKVGKTDVGIVMGRGNAHKARYALDAAVDVVAYYNDYFGVPFPLPKLDNVAGPGQSQFFGAMENWGAIFTFERVLLLDPKFTSVGGKQSIYVVNAHEIAHQWFGDLVTMQWWDDLWLNEGFATWMEGKTTAKFNPSWQAELGRVGRREAAMGLDAVATTHPVIQTIKTVEQSSQAFDAITYQKGASVITMLEGFAGENVWRTGIRAYMKKHAYGNTKTDDLWAAVEGAGAKGLTQIAHDFTRQPGIPLIRVTSSQCVNGTTKLSLTQGEFSRDRKQLTDASKLRWAVPVIAQSLGKAPARTIVQNGAGELSVPGCGTVVLNAGQSGYYRTAYTPEMQAALSRDFTKFKPIDQLGLMDDAVQMSHGEYQPMSVALDLIGAVKADASPAIVGNALGDWAGYRDRFKGDAATQAKIGSLLARKYGGLLDKLGFVPRANEAAPVSLLRNALIGVLGWAGDPRVRAEAKAKFAALEKDPKALDGPMKTLWLGVIADTADKQVWDRLHALAKSSNDQVLKSSYYALLGAMEDPALAKAALDLALTDEPGKTDAAAMIGAVAREHPDMAVDFVLANLAKVEPLVDVSSRSRYVGELASGSRDPKMIDKLEAYAKAHLTPESRKPVDRAINSIKTRLNSEPRIKAGVQEWLEKNGAN